MCRIEKNLVHNRRWSLPAACILLQAGWAVVWRRRRGGDKKSLPADGTIADINMQVSRCKLGEEGGRGSERKGRTCGEGRDSRKLDGYGKRGRAGDKLVKRKKEVKLRGRGRFFFVFESKIEKFEAN